MKSVIFLLDIVRRGWRILLFHQSEIGFDWLKFETIFCFRREREQSDKRSFNIFIPYVLKLGFFTSFVSKL